MIIIIIGTFGRRRREKPADKWFPMIIEAAAAFSRGSANLND